MSKDAAYHEAVVDYNRRFAEFAEKQAEIIPDELMQKWCRGIAKQHRAHERRHQRALDRINGTYYGANVKHDSSSVPESAVGDDNELSAEEISRLDAITEEINA